MRPDLKFAVGVAVIAAVATAVIDWRLPGWASIMRGVLIAGAMILTVALSAPLIRTRKR